MPDARTLRDTRLNNEYEELKKMSSKGGMLEISGLDRPKERKITVIFRIPTIIGFNSSGPVMRDVSTVDITIPADYPQGLPLSIMRERQPWHPNW